MLDLPLKHKSTISKATLGKFREHAIRMLSSSIHGGRITEAGFVRALASCHSFRGAIIGKI